MPFLAQVFDAFFKFSSTQFSSVILAMTVEETARILCEPSVGYSEFERAILLFGLQVAILSPARPQVASYARLHAATKVLEYIEHTNSSSVGASLMRGPGL